MEHVDIPLGEVHTPHNWQWADAQARLAEVVTDVTLIDRVGLQLSDGTLWRLAAVLPAVVWEPVAQVVPWASVTGKPETFAPGAHGHAVADVAGLQAALDGKQPTGAYIVEGDARLADARPASDVYAWAKAASKPTYTAAEVGAATAGHGHSDATTSAAGFMSAADKTKLDGVAANANNYSHPTGDGNLHVPATGTTNAGKVLTAGATAGSLSWVEPLALGSTAGTELGTAAAGTATTAARSDHVHPVQTSVSGNAGTATKLETARTINGVSFDGSANIDISYPNLTSKPTLGTAAAKDIPATGNAAATQVVLGNDSRLSDARTPTAHTHAISDVTGLQTALNAKQPTLVSGTNIKTINSTSLLGSGNIDTGDVTLTGTQTLTNKTVEAGVFTNGYTEEVATASTGTAYTINLANGSVQILTLTGNVTYTFPTAVAGKSFLLVQKQDATGSRTATWPAAVKWPGNTAPTLTSTASKADVFAFTCDGTNWFGRVIGQAYL